MTEPARETGTPSARGALSERLGSTRARVAAGVAVLVIVAGIVVAVVVSGGSSSNVNPIAPIELSASGLRTLASAVPQPIYWIGPQKGYFYELTRMSNGNVAIRYLPSGVKAGAPGSQYLVVTTVPKTGAFHALKASASGKQVSVSGGGIALADAGDPTHVQLAYPAEPYQVELYDPPPANALNLAASGTVRPVTR
jgi:hypothetical protein